jgi:hypothetical protein
LKYHLGKVLSLLGRNLDVITLSKQTCGCEQHEQESHHHVWHSTPGRKNKAGTDARGVWGVLRPRISRAVARVQFRNHTWSDDEKQPADRERSMGFADNSLAYAENVNPAIHRRVQDRIVGGIGQDDRPVDYRLNQICRVGQILRKTRRFDGRNPVSRLYPRIEQDALDLFENEPRQNQNVSAENDVQ